MFIRRDGILGGSAFIMISGTGANDMYKSRRQYFEDLAFLNANVTPRMTSSNLRWGDKSELQTDGYAYQLPAKRVKKRVDGDRSEELLESAINFLKAPKKPSSNETGAKPAKPNNNIFADMVGSIMGEINDGYEKDMVIMEVMKFLYEAKHKQRHH